MVILSCKKNNITPPELGSISGNVHPIGAFSAVYLTDVNGVRYTAEVSVSTGNFSFTNLPAGSYTLGTPENSRFYTSENKVLEVLGGRHRDVGVLSFNPVVQASGAISGALLPVGFGERITITNVASGQNYSMSPHPDSGKFLFTLPNGTYRVSFTALGSAAAPPEVMVNVVSNSIDLGSMMCGQGDSGSILFKVNPMLGMRAMQATNLQNGEVVSGRIDRYNATVSFPAMVQGTYRIAITTYIPFLAPAPIDVVVYSRKETDMGTLTLIKDVNKEVLSFFVGSRSWLSYYSSATLTDGVLRLSMSDVISIAQKPNQTSRYAGFTIVMDKINGPGKYVFTGSANSNMSYQEIWNTGITSKTYNWSINGVSSNGELEILSIDPVGRRIRGNFSATLAYQTAGEAEPNKEITEGSFYLAY